MRLKLINLYALLAGSVLYGMGNPEKDESFFSFILPSASSTNRALSEAAHRILSNSQNTQQTTPPPLESTSSSSSSSSSAEEESIEAKVKRLYEAARAENIRQTTSTLSNLRSQEGYNIRERFEVNNTLGVIFYIPVKHITEENLRAFAEIIKDATESGKQISIRLARSYSIDNGGRPTTILTLDDLKLVARYFPTLRGLDLQDTGLDLEIVEFLTRTESFPMLEWLNISYNFKPDFQPEESAEQRKAAALSKRANAQAALELILAHPFAPLLKRLEIVGLNIQEDAIRKLMYNADNRRAYLVGEDGSLQTPVNDFLQERLTIIISEDDYIEPLKKARKRIQHELLLRQTLKKHKASQEDSDKNQKGKDAATDMDEL